MPLIVTFVSVSRNMPQQPLQDPVPDTWLRGCTKVIVRARYRARLLPDHVDGVVDGSIIQVAPLIRLPNPVVADIGCLEYGSVRRFEVADPMLGDLFLLRGFHSSDFAPKTM